MLLVRVVTRGALAIAFACTFAIGISGSPQSAPASAAVANPVPRVFLLSALTLSQIRSADPQDSRRQAVIRAATAEADRAMHEGPFSVMRKSAVPPSGDKHDYMSRAPYFWPDPAKPDGLPYIRRDGEHNPEIRKISDHDDFGRMANDARALALAYYLTGNSAYADRSVLLLRTWFLNPATRMNPNLEFAQGIPGINTGRGIGIIESRALMYVTDAVGLLAGSQSWSAADQSAFEAWLTKYLNWMRNSDKGKAEDAAKNNHGTWYDLQLVDFALFLGNPSLAVETLQRVKTKRIAVQIEPDGRQPLELSRTNAWGYSNGNLDGLTQLATLGSQVGVDLWNFSTPDGRSIRAAIDFLLPYALGQKKWDYQQISGFQAGSLLHILARASTPYNDANYEAAARKLAPTRDDSESQLLKKY